MKILITALCLCVVPAVAAPACATGTYASYQALAGGCTIGNALFTNFSNLAFVNSPGVPVLTSSEIEVIPSGSATQDLLTFVYQNANGVPTPVTVNQNGQIFSMGLTFDILVLPGSLTGIQMDSTFSNTSPGSASASKTAQLLSGGPAITSTVNDGGGSNPLGTYAGILMPVTGAGTFLITDTTSLEAETGSVTQSGFANAFVLTGAAATPEVSSLAMIGSGLVFLSMVGNATRRRRKAKDQVR